MKKEGRINKINFSFKKIIVNNSLTVLRETAIIFFRKIKKLSYQFPTLFSSIFEKKYFVYFIIDGFIRNGHCFEGCKSVRAGQIKFTTNPDSGKFAENQ